MRGVKILFIIVSIAIIVLEAFVGCGGGAKNTAPDIESFQADPVSVSSGDQVALTISAVDAENDTLTYTYQPEAGSDKSIKHVSFNADWIKAGDGRR